MIPIRKTLFADRGVRLPPLVLGAWMERDRSCPDLMIDRQEKIVNFLQAQARRLRVKEVYDRDESRQEDREQNVGGPMNPTDHHWRDHDNAEVPHPVAAHRDRNAASPGFQWQDLGTPYPGNDIDSRTKHQHVKVEECNRSIGSIVCPNAEQDGDHHHTEREESAAGHHRASAAQPIEEEGGNGIPKGKHELDTYALVRFMPQARSWLRSKHTTCNQCGPVSTHANVFDEDSRHVVDNEVDL
jgi:hypothetical protein